MNNDTVFNDNFAASCARALQAGLADGVVDLRSLAACGHLAPSVHNTQPWEFVLDQRTQTITIRLSQRITLTHSDATKRQTWLSVGAAMQNILTVAAAAQIGSRYELSDDGVRIWLQLPAKSAQSLDVKALTIVIAVIVARRSDRHDYTDRPLITKQRQRLASVSTQSQLRTRLYDQPEVIEALAGLVEQATRLAFSNRSMRHELVKHINAPWRPQPTGIPARAIAHSPLSALVERGTTKSGKFVASKASTEADRLRHSSCLALIFSAGDTKSDWIEAGRAYEALCLEATRQGLAHSTLAVLVEAPDYYKEVSAITREPWRLQMMVRLGYSTHYVAATERLPLDQVLHLTDNA